MSNDPLKNDPSKLLAAMDFAAVAADREAEHRDQMIALFRSLFDIVDSFDRMLADVERDDNGRPTVAPMATAQLIAKQLDQALRGAGVEEVPALGTTLDPNLHQVVEVRRSALVPDEVVVAVTIRGYMWNGMVLRPAQVVVATSKGNANEANRDRH